MFFCWHPPLVPPSIFEEYLDTFVSIKLTKLNHRDFFTLEHHGSANMCVPTKRKLPHFGEQPVVAGCAQYTSEPFQLINCVFFRSYLHFRCVIYPQIDPSPFMDEVGSVWALIDFFVAHLFLSFIPK